jgi:hypothetical protein
MNPEPTTQPAAVAQRCRLLRHKGMYVESEPDPSVPSMESHCYWCVYTQNVLGPDGKVCAPDTCTPDRACYEPL